jgi:hypothetical protein
MLTILPGIHSGPPFGRDTGDSGHSGSRQSIRYRRAMDSMYSIYSGVDHLGTVGKVAPGPFAQEGRCWRMVYENPVGQGGHCMEPVTWVGRWKFLMARSLDEGVELRPARRRADWG